MGYEICGKQTKGPNRNRATATFWRFSSHFVGNSTTRYVRKRQMHETAKTSSHDRWIVRDMGIHTMRIKLGDEGITLLYECGRVEGHELLS